MKLSSAVFAVFAVFALFGASTAVAQVPDGWTCRAFFFDTDDGCDCGCGVADPDCATAAFASCEFDQCEDTAGGQLVPSQANPTTCVANVCGDGVTDGLELCDDDNATSGDGCNATCTLVEPTFDCVRLPGPVQGDGGTNNTLLSVCRVVECGDEFVNGVENCDDGNATRGDGCDDECQEEVGFACDAAGGPCHAIVCSDELLDFPEDCDDGNTTIGDGCDANCNEEANFVCVTPGQPCRPIVCGDEFADGLEDCDDGNTTPGDGCDATCTLEDNFVCEREGTPCRAIVCGDGLRDFPEECDDSSDAAGDGCSEVCAVEDGFVCETEGAACREIVCGDGIVDFDFGPDGELCDDSNTTAGDGCDATCGSEAGFVCGDDGDACRPIVCGDGIIDFDPVTFDSEDCDDGNTAAADGCDAACTEEPGFICEVEGEACRRTVCGDSINEGSEDCDDGNGTAGDGCSDTCLEEDGFVCPEEGEPCIAVPAGWTCTPGFFGTGDGCDCGCGVVDADCASPAIEECEFGGECAGVEDVDPADTTQCLGGGGEGEGEGEEGEGEGEGGGGGGTEGEGEGPTPQPTGCAATPMVTTSTMALLASLAMLNRRRKR